MSLRSEVLGGLVIVVLIAGGLEYTGYTTGPAEIPAADPEDLAGLVALNTLKGTYLPGETAEMIVVVLDRDGRPVPDADLAIEVREPDGTIYEYSTGNGITPGGKPGTYLASHRTGLEGIYTITATAAGPGVKNTFKTSFRVDGDYPFDILRSADSVIDPTKEDRFNVKIDIFSRTDADRVTIKESVPSGLTVDTDAQMRVGGNKTVLTWERTFFDNRTGVNYTYTVSEAKLNLYAFGPVDIIYGDRTFTEAWEWFVAVDPVVNHIVNSDFESGSEPDADNWTEETTTSQITTEWDSIGGNPSGNMYMHGRRGDTGEGFSVQDFNYTGTTPPDSVNLSFDWYRYTRDADKSSLYVELKKPGEGAYNTILWSNTGTGDQSWKNEVVDITGNFLSPGTYSIRLLADIQVANTGPSPNNNYVHIRWDNVAINVSDTTPPVITIESPTNSTYGVNNTDYNITVDEALSWALVSIDGGTNMTMTNDTLYHFFNLSSQHANLSDGPHNATFYAQDLHDNNASKTVYFTIDTAVPEIDIESPQNITYATGDIHFNISVTNVNMTNGWVVVDGDNYTLVNDSLSHWYNITVPTLSEGYYTATFYGNRSGNINSKNVSFTVDTSKPYRIDQNYPQNDTNITKSYINFNWTSYDNISTSLTSNLTIDGVVNVSDIATTNATPFIQLVSGFSDGPHNWSVTTWDPTGNGNTSATYYFMVDTTPPTVIPILPISGSNISGSIAINASVNDTSGVDVQQWHWENSTNTSLSWPDLNGTLNTTTLQDGNYNITYWANDTLGNTNGTEYVAITVDNTVPSVTINTPQNTTITDTTPDLNFTIDETTGTIYNWDGEGNISGCVDCMSFNTTYGEASGSDGNISLLAHLNEGSDTTANDDSTYDNNGTITGATWVTGKFGNALDFNGSDEVDFGDPVDGSLDFALTDSFTIMAWIKIPSGQISAKAYHVIDKGGGWTNPGYHVTVCGTVNYCDNTTSPGSVWAMVHPDGGAASARLNIKSTTLVNDSQWHHIAFVRDTSADEGYLYIDGVLEANETDPTDATSYTSDPFVVGNASTSTQTFASNLIGSVDEVIVIRRALGSSEVQAYYDKTLSDGQHNVTVYVTDGAGNTNFTTRYFTIDTSVPSVTINTPQNTTYPAPTQIINATVIDALSPISSVIAEINGTVNVTLVQDGTTDYYNATYTFSEGLNNVRIYANDSEGNMNGTQIVYFTIDISPPSVENLFTSPVVVPVNDTVNITAGVTDTVGIDTVLVNINNGTWSKNYTMQNITNNTWYYAFNETYSTGTYTATIIANDTAGNVNDTESINFTVSLPDLTLSRNNITFSKSAPVAGNTVTITATISNIGLIDSNSGLIQLIIDGSVRENYTRIINGSSTEDINYTWSDTTAGTHTITVVLDVNNSIQELNETNNNASRSITVTSPPPSTGGGGDPPPTTTTTTTTSTTTVPTTTIPPTTPPPDTGNDYRSHRDRTKILPLELGLPSRIIKSALEPIKEIIYILNNPEVIKESWNQYPWYYEDEFILTLVALFILLIGLYRRR